jgi:hypothetical protein
MAIADSVAHAVAGCIAKIVAIAGYVAKIVACRLCGYRCRLCDSHCKLQAYKGVKHVHTLTATATHNMHS